MKISYITQGDESLASYRYRMLIPGSIIAKTHEVFIDKVPEKNADIFIFSKHWAADIEFAKSVKHEGFIVFDICDNHFEDQYRDHYLEMCQRAHVLTCSSEKLHKIIRKKAGKWAHVIQDPFEMPFQEASFNPGEVPKLVWFGHSSNLGPLTNTQIVGELEIVTNCKPKQEGPVTWTAWTPQSQIEAMNRADIVIIPQTNPAKGNNRLIESIRMGKFVVASSIPSYDEFRDFAYVGDIKDGVLWALENKDEVLQRIKSGQAYIEKHYSPQKIANDWLGLFDRMQQYKERVTA